jgi:hypothetical protein
MVGQGSAGGNWRQPIALDAWRAIWNTPHPHILAALAVDADATFRPRPPHFLKLTFSGFRHERCT